MTLLALLVGVVVGCGGGDPDNPGEGTSVTPARANWSTGWFQAEVYANLLRRLGYEVSDPADNEFSRPDFYDNAARGDVDFWANGWFPGSEADLDRTLDGVGRIGDLVEPVGLEVEKGALSGILVDSTTAKAEGIRSLGDIVADPRLARLFDLDGNGKADILGCPDDWVCAGEIDDLIADAGPDALEQVRGDYEPHVQRALRRIQAGRPVLLYSWTPTATVERLVPGEEVVWLDSSPVGAPEVVFLDRGACTKNRCRMGFAPNDIKVAANSEFLAQNPAAAALLEAVEIPVEDIQAQNLAMVQGADSPTDIADQAEVWLGERRGLVLDWLRTARSAAEDA